ncbi:MAG: hypothetical protein JWO31_3204 [Phycisphaerales bacterium]|nr:hypothetical protein [Phycisphaerales bacterium]
MLTAPATDDPAAYLGHLTRRQREAMMARLGPGNTVIPQELVAVRLGITQSAVSRRIAGGIDRLRRRGVSVSKLMDRLGVN